jgi:ribose 1,5-bisphosphokinase PhnN
VSTLLYLVGSPGVGKSTLMAALTERCQRLARTQPFAHDHLLRHDPTGLLSSDPVAVELGKRRDAFSGTDSLGMSVQPKAVEWIATKPHSLILGEGARLGTVGFLMAARNSGYKVMLVHLTADQHTLAERRLARGSTQNEQWMRGAATRAVRLTERMQMDADVHVIRADRPPHRIADFLLGLDPELEVLR